MGGQDQVYLFKFKLEAAPGRGFSHAKTERIILGLMKKVTLDGQRFLETYFNCEISEEGIGTVTFKFTIELKKYKLDQLIELRYQAQLAIEQAFGIGYGETRPEKMNVPQFILWVLGIEDKPEDKKDRKEKEYETVEIDSAIYEEALRNNGVIPVSHIQDLDKQKKED